MCRHRRERIEKYLTDALFSTAVIAFICIFLDIRICNHHLTYYNFILWEDKEDLKEKLINRIKATIL